MITLYDCVTVPCPRSARILLIDKFVTEAEWSQHARTLP